MNMVPVESSNIASIGYENGTLAVRFKSGATFNYAGVPVEKHKALMEAESVGSYFAREIKDTFEAVRAEDEEGATS
jgi:hypothetical protein